MGISKNYHTHCVSLALTALMIIMMRHADSDNSFPAD